MNITFTRSPQGCTWSITPDPQDTLDQLAALDAHMLERFGPKPEPAPCVNPLRVAQVLSALAQMTASGEKITARSLIQRVRGGYLTMSQALHVLRDAGHVRITPSGCVLTEAGIAAVKAQP